MEKNGEIEIELRKTPFGYFVSSISAVHLVIMLWSCLARPEAGGGLRLDADAGYVAARLNFTAVGCHRDGGHVGHLLRLAVRQERGLV